MKILFSNKKASLNYQKIDSYEAGMVLSGTEVKSLAKSNGNIDEAFIIIKDSEVFIINMYIAPFENGNIHNLESTRTRKLLLNKNEILRINQKAKKEHLAIIPIKIYFKNKKIKLEIALSKSKNERDKREDLKQRDSSREINKYK